MPSLRTLRWSDASVILAQAAALYLVSGDLFSAGMRLPLLAAAFAATAAAFLVTSVAALGVLVLLSNDEFHRLVKSALRASVAAMWIPGAALLASVRTPATSVIGLALIANAARLFAGHTIGRRRRIRASLRRGERMFRSARVESGLAATLPAIGAALLFHTGAIAIWRGAVLPAVVCVAIAAAVWTSRAIAKGAYRPPASVSPARSLLGATLTFVLAMSLLASQFERNLASLHDAGFADMWRLREKPPDRKPAQIRLAEVPRKILMSGSGLVPGVILRPEKPGSKAMPHASFPRPSLLRLSRPLTFAFTGEYRLFPSSSGGVQRDSTVYLGTPLDAIYKTTGGGALETHAWQQLRPPVDLAHCARIRVTMINGERALGSATLHITGAQGVTAAGSQVFGFEPGPEEILDFSVPLQMRTVLATAMSVSFRYADPLRRSESARVAVKEFTLIPATY